MYHKQNNWVYYPAAGIIGKPDDMQTSKDQNIFILGYWSLFLITWEHNKGVIPHYRNS